MPTPYKIKLLNGLIKLKTFGEQVIQLLGIKDSGTRTGVVTNQVVDWSLQHFTKTTAQWNADTATILLIGQLGIENTGTNTYKLKIGDGTSLWSALGYAGGGSSSIAWGAITGTLANQTDLQTALDAEETARIAGDASTLSSANAYTDSEISSAVVGLLDDRGNYDASGNTFPASGGSGTAGAILKGDLWTISVAGTLGSVPVTTGDVVRALTDSPGQTASNWNVTENNIGYVPENNANKVQDFSDPTSTVKFPVIKAIIDYFSAANIRSILGITTLSGSNTGDQTRPSLGIGSGTIIVTSGTSFTTPANITTSTNFKIVMIGGGGGGGGINTLNAKGSGAGGGAACILWISGLAASTSYTCAIGAGGAGGGPAANGTAGGSTTLIIGATTYTAGGGGLGLGAVNSAGGAGGIATNGTLNLPGQNGGDSPSVASSASSDAAGGDSAYGFGAGGPPVRVANNGNPGVIYGGGGSGGFSTGTSGGAGANGVIYAEYFN